MWKILICNIISGIESDFIFCYVIRSYFSASFRGRRGIVNKEGIHLVFLSGDVVGVIVVFGVVCVGLFGWYCVLLLCFGRSFLGPLWLPIF